MCRALAVSAAGYYAWRSPGVPVGVGPDVLSAIRVIHHPHRAHRVARLMRQDGIRPTVKKWRATTPSNHRLPVAPRSSQFTVEAPIESGPGTSYVWTTEGWLYLAVLALLAP